MITNKFKELIAKAINGEGFTAPTYLAWGDDNTAPTGGDTALGSELERNLKDSNIQQNNTVEIVGTLLTTELVGSTIKEAGLLNASSGGDLFIRNVFPDIEKTNQFEISTINIINIR